MWYRIKMEGIFMYSEAANKSTIRTMVLTGLMIAITFIMSYTFLGTIILPVVSITLAFIPAIVTVMTVGFVPGLIVAASAGIFSLIRAFYVFTWLAPFLQNPLVSVFPRVMIVVAVFAVFAALNKTKLPKVLTVGISAAAGSITNTVGVLGMAWLLYGAAWHEVAVERGHASVWAMIVFIVTTNAALEVVGNTIIVTAVVMTLRKARLSKF